VCARSQALAAFDADDFLVPATDIAPTAMGDATNAGIDAQIRDDVWRGADGSRAVHGDARTSDDDLAEDAELMLADDGTGTVGGLGMQIDESGHFSSAPEGAQDAQLEEAYDDTYVPPVLSSAGETRTIRFQTRILNQHLVCTLCMGYFNDACTIIECLHTFCRVCIMRHFRDSSMCPQCEAELGTNPKDLVRTDRTLQSIVDKVFPPLGSKAETAASSSAPPDAGATDSATGAVLDALTTAVSAATTGATYQGASATDDGSWRGGGWEVDAEGEGGGRAHKVARLNSAGGASAPGPSNDDTVATAEEEISFSLQELEGSRQHVSALEKPYLRTKVRRVPDVRVKFLPLVTRHHLPPLTGTTHHWPFAQVPWEVC